MWTTEGNAPAPAACSPGTWKYWQSALDYVACLNDNAYFGYNDWRLPNVNEVESLVHAGQSSTAAWLNNQGFTNVQDNYYWSSTTHARVASNAHIVHMLYSVVNIGDKATSACNVWPVRAGQ